MRIDPKITFRANIGFTAGISVAFLGLFIFLVVFPVTPVDIGTRIAMGIGFACALGMDIIQLLGLIEGYKNYLKAMDMMKKAGEQMKKESHTDYVQ